METSSSNPKPSRLKWSNFNQPPALFSQGSNMEQLKKTIKAEPKCTDSKAKNNVHERFRMVVINGNSLILMF